MRKEVEKIVYRDRYYDVVKEVEVEVPIHKEVVEYVPVPVDNPIERVVEVPVERIWEVVVEKIIEVPEEIVITKTVIEEREKEVVVEVVKEVPRIVEPSSILMCQSWLRHLWLLKIQSTQRTLSRFFKESPTSLVNREKTPF